MSHFCSCIILVLNFTSENVIQHALVLNNLIMRLANIYAGNYTASYYQYPIKYGLNMEIYTWKCVARLDYHTSDNLLGLVP